MPDLSSIVELIVPNELENVGFIVESFKNRVNCT